MNEANPYQTPQAEVEKEEQPADRSRLRLASRWSRLAAALIDGVVLFVAVLVPFIALVVVDNTLIDNPWVLIVIGPIAFVAVNGYLMARHGQTIGKRAVGIRMVRTDGSRASLSRLFLLRWGVPYLISALLSVVPSTTDEEANVISWLVSLVDVLFIFGAAHRCLHDYLADTIVIEAHTRSYRRRRRTVGPGLPGDREGDGSAAVRTRRRQDSR